MCEYRLQRRYRGCAENSDDLFREILQKNLLGTVEEPSHTIVDYENSSDDYERMCECAEAKGYMIVGDKVMKLEE